MGFTSIDLSKLLFIINLDPNAVLEHILNMLLLGHFLALFVIKGHDLLEVRWMTPCNLNRRRCLGYMGEYSLVERILLNLDHVFLDSHFLIVSRPQSMQTSVSFSPQYGLVPRQLG